MAGDGPALELDGLHKVFGDLVAVDHLDLTVPAGSFFGLVGRNGAGKTTTLRMCTALLRPDDGSVRIDGVDVWADPQEAKRRMGVMPESMDVFDRLTGAELLLYDGLLRGMDRDLVVERSTELLDVLELTDAAARTVADYSTA
ncbi:MAG: ABC transporter ATP-binding protein [Acidimicrobiales bacterium]